MKDLHQSNTDEESVHKCSKIPPDSRPFDETHWREYHTLVEFQFYPLSTPPFADRKWTYGRVYYLSCPDDEATDGYLWAGKLAVYNNDIRELVQFRPTRDLSPDGIVHVHASNEPAQTEYYYEYNNAKDKIDSRERAKCCFNVIYDDRPLPGWWPWPEKNKDGAVT
ncbi:hypothetical protein Micbo1qcDRAFT_179375 [Microdochium bolleyi]|uniref:Uncharacterized protein n=1 Tax=Microdochium bolleyi TaxID=196109 RepID=A0A136IQC5_9PEZI|nr:hypothetical protein Micbo1qcDRAFT_179375 [Microdochium bolleyi]